MKLRRCFSVVCSAPMLLSGCVPLTTNSPIISSQLKTISAGHTGCMPDENEISNATDSPYSVIWNATCRGKTYLCSGVSDMAGARTYSCAPMAQ